MDETHTGSRFLTIPSKMIHDKEISTSSLLLFGLIVMYSDKDGNCTASNSYLAKELGMTERQVQYSLGELEHNNYITRTSSREYQGRIIFAHLDGRGEQNFMGDEQNFIGGERTFVGGEQNFAPKPSKNAYFSQKSDEKAEISQNQSSENTKNEKEKSIPPLSLTPLSSSSLNNPISNTPHNPLTPIEEEKETPLSPDPRDLLFDEFWKAYPKKNGKKYARQAFMSIKGLSKVFPTMMNALEKQKKSQDWFKDHGQYIPNPATWIHQERWNDEGVKDTFDEVSEALREKYPEWYEDDNNGNSNDPF